MTDVKPEKNIEREYLKITLLKTLKERKKAKQFTLPKYALTCGITNQIS